MDDKLLVAGTTLFLPVYVPGALFQAGDGHAAQGHGEVDVSAPADTVQRWSTDPRSRVPALPRLDPGDPLPHCRQSVHRGTVLHG